MNNHLEHHGVKGMKWGVRKKRIKERHKAERQSLKESHSRSSKNVLQKRGDRRRLKRKQKNEYETYKLKYDKNAKLKKDLGRDLVMTSAVLTLPIAAASGAVGVRTLKKMQAERGPVYQFKGQPRRRSKYI